MDENVLPFSDELERLEATGDLKSIAESPAFSAIASGGATREDFKRLEFLLISAGVAKEKCNTDRNIHSIVRYITNRVWPAEI